MIEKAVEVDADSSQFPSNWIFHNREKKPGKAFVDGLNLRFHTQTLYLPAKVHKIVGSVDLSTSNCSC